MRIDLKMFICIHFINLRFNGQALIIQRGKCLLKCGKTCTGYDEFLFITALITANFNGYQQLYYYQCLFYSLDVEKHLSS